MENFAVYCRKSTDTEDRQILSLDSQKNDIIEKIIKPRNIKPIVWLEESQSAKNPGRLQFNKLIELVERNQINRVITWHINRLARNSVDGGKLTWLVQNKRLEIITPIKSYNENDIFMLYVEFGMANQFSNDLSKMTERGIKDKIRMGLAPIKAPIGYYNDKMKPKGLKDIQIDTKRFAKVRKMWELLLSHRYTPAYIYKIASKEWGLKHRNGGLLSRTQTYELFRNIFYTGNFLYKGEAHCGKHQQMITMAEFETAQKILNLRGKDGNKKHKSTFTGILRCPCKGSITATVKPRMICPKCHYKFNPQRNEYCPKCGMRKDSMDAPLRIYTYYHCSRKRISDCNQPIVNEHNLENQITNELEQITIPNDFVEWGRKYIKKTMREQVYQTQEITETLKQHLAIEKQKAKNLFEKFIHPDNAHQALITNAEYQNKKNELKKTIVGLEEQLKNIGHKPQYATNTTERTFNFSYRARYWFENGNREQKRTILTTLDQNPILEAGLLRLNLLKPLEYIKITKKRAFGINHEYEPENQAYLTGQARFLELGNSVVGG
jgi:site-specific DNA recombinase